MLLNVKAILVKNHKTRQTVFNMPDMEVFMSVKSPNQLKSMHKLINPDTRHLLISGQKNRNN